MSTSKQRLIDVDIARDLFGKRVLYIRSARGDDGWRQFDEDDDLTAEGTPVPHYTTEIAAAWPVVEALLARGIAPLLLFETAEEKSAKPWHVNLVRLHHNDIYWEDSVVWEINVWEATMPIAVCVAALEAVRRDA